MNATGGCDDRRSELETSHTTGVARGCGQRNLGLMLACGGRRRVQTPGGRRGSRRIGGVQRRFVAEAPDRLWVTDITQHRASEGWVYCAAVIDVHSRRCVGWSIADHLRAGLVVDALDMARWQRKPVGTTVGTVRQTVFLA